MPAVKAGPQLTGNIESSKNLLWNLRDRLNGCLSRDLRRRSQGGIMKSIIKRTGQVVLFDQTKIENAVAQAFVATGELDTRDVSSVARTVALMAGSAIREQGIETPTVEQVQDEVEKALMTCGFPKTAKAYILYRSQHQKLRNTKDTLLDYKKLVDGYIGSEKDWRVKENSTVTMSVAGLILTNR